MIVQTPWTARPNQHDTYLSCRGCMFGEDIHSCKKWLGTYTAPDKMDVCFVAGQYLAGRWDHKTYNTICFVVFGRGSSPTEAYYDAGYL